jgi:hypothetical protein
MAIQICKKALDEQLKVLSDISVEADLTADNLQMIDMEDLVSVTLFHEVGPINTGFSVNQS